MHLPNEMNNSSEEEHITSEQIQQEDLFHKLEVRYLTATKENDELKTKIQQLQAERDILGIFLKYLVLSLSIGNCVIKTRCYKQITQFR